MLPHASYFKHFLLFSPCLYQILSVGTISKKVPLRSEYVTVVSEHVSVCLWRETAGMRKVLRLVMGSISCYHSDNPRGQGTMWTEPLCEVLFDLSAQSLPLSIQNPQHQPSCVLRKSHFPQTLFSYSANSSVLV